MQGAAVRNERPGQVVAGTASEARGSKVVRTYSNLTLIGSKVVRT